MATSTATASRQAAVPPPLPESRPGFTADDVPRPLGRYVLLRRIARGGMGEVFLASTTGLEGAERPVVVKVIRREHAADPSYIARFLDEARVQSQLQHSGVAQVIEADVDPVTGEPYAVVEHVEGRSLGELRARAVQLGQRFAWAEGVAIATMIAEALAHVHERQDAVGAALGIVHRDLSPQNVMLGFSGDVKIIDFGTARGQNRRCHTVSGVVFAKPGYVAPEVANGDSGDARVDLYALGIMLWELCAGRRFLQGDAQAHLAAVARNQNDPPPIAAELGAPRDLDVVIARLTAFDREVRYLSSRAAARDLAALLADAPAVPTGERGVRARAAHLMQRLFPGEPARSRREFATLAAAARALRAGIPTPVTHRAEAMAAAERADSDMLPGTRYRLIREIGRGASSVVYESEHVDLHRRLALKVVSAEQSASEVVAARFRREGRVLSQLSHEHLVKVHDFGLAADGRLFCGMDLLEGETLDAYMAREAVARPIDWRDAFATAIKVLRALEFAHAEGLVHRDIKPANLFLTRPAGMPGAPSLADAGLKLLDFGLARSLFDERGAAARPLDATAGEVGPARASVAIVGTPEYMAPEQAASGRIDGRADLYALGCVLYEMLTGRLPFVEASLVALLDAKIKGSPERLRDRAPTRYIPAFVDDLVMRALARHPSVRFQTAAEMRKAVEAALAAPERSRSRRRAAGFAALAAVMSFAGVLLVGKARDIVAVVPPAAAALFGSVTQVTAPPGDATPQPGSVAAATTPDAAGEPTALPAAVEADPDPVEHGLAGELEEDGTGATALAPGATADAVAAAAPGGDAVATAPAGAEPPQDVASSALVAPIAATSRERPAHAAASRPARSVTSGGSARKPREVAKREVPAFGRSSSTSASASGASRPSHATPDIQKKDDRGEAKRRRNKKRTRLAKAE